MAKYVAQQYEIGSIVAKGTGSRRQIGMVAKIIPRPGDPGRNVLVMTRYEHHIRGTILHEALWNEEELWPVLSADGQTLEG